MKQAILENLKNVWGWNTPRKLVAFAVDDYCNVRLSSRAARNSLSVAGLDVSSHFDQFDSMETRQDLEALFEVLDSVRDVHGRHAIFTAYALSANPDFEQTLRDGERYHYEPVTRTFQRLTAEQPAAYEGAWSLWQEGMEKGLMQPQFHGREHFNVRLFEEKMGRKSPDLLVNLQNGSLAGLKGESIMPGVGFSKAFSVHDDDCLESQTEVIRDGVRLFEQCFGFSSATFTPPGQAISPELYPVCAELGIRLIHKPRNVIREMKGRKRIREFSWTGRQHPAGHVSLVRNAVFEPGMNDERANENRVIEQLRSAFRWRKPAVISSHRVNFCGHIDENNRFKSLGKLRRLLQMIVSEWPDVEFVPIDDLGRMITAASQSPNGPNNSLDHCQ